MLVQVSQSSFNALPLVGELAPLPRGFTFNVVLGAHHHSSRLVIGCIGRGVVVRCDIAGMV
jgi:hypothetical protein